MRMTLVRHGETIENQNHILQGQLPGRLSERGMKEAGELAKVLAQEDFSCIYSSDLERCRRTAGIVCEKMENTPILFDSRLRELDFGIYTGLCRRSLDWERAKHAALAQPMPGGESWLDIELRLRRFLKDIQRTSQCGDILIITHRGPMRVIKAIMEESPLSSVITEPIPNCGILRFEITEISRERQYT